MESTVCDIIIDTIHCDVRPELRKYIFEKDETKKVKAVNWEKLKRL